ncbi:capsular biosynthesis protein [Paraburkholderia metrosideri]|uniref:Capsular biosynthesis protein n=1 Tax=Paraburkholderia metrosideri TaxID=580937 RepID=A0ABW9DZV5_9BURK
MRRSFLALQGTASPFFSELATALMKRGHRFTRVNFCGGDLAYAGSERQLNFNGRLEDLPGWYESAIEEHDVTDIVMFGDCRAVHQPMHAASRAKGKRVYVFEEGYVRPHWITLEETGVNGRSHLPRDASWYLAQRGRVPACPTALQTGYNLYERAFHDIRYRAANALYNWRFRHYRSHRPRNGLVEYSGLAVRMLLQRNHNRDARQIMNDLVAKRGEYYIFPLQLNSDAQIVVHSPFDGVCAAIDQAVRSFAKHAPDQTWLVVKNHPLDTGLVNYRRHTERLAIDLGISHRLRFIDAGHLPTLLENAKGALVVNSTVGLSALHHGCPLVALGTAIYDVDGLTWQGDIDDFWTQAIAPDMALYSAFLDYVVHHTQINGDFYTRSGIAMATAGAVQRLEAATRA